jgi:hypothetical protein
VKYCTVALVLEGIPPPSPPFSVESAEGVDIYRAFEQLSAKLGVQMHKLDLTFRYPCIIADPIVIARMQRYDPGRMMTLFMIDPLF